MQTQNNDTYDFVIIGSGFGGSVSALRLVQKGYRVLVLERGKRFNDNDFARRNWDIRRYLWMPWLRCFGIQELTFLQDVLVLHGSGVGGGSLVYANVLMEPGDNLFEAPDWRDLADWKTVLQPHYATARQMLGVTANPYRGPADSALQAVAADLGHPDSFQLAQVGVFFGEPDRAGQLVPDPYFDGAGPPRAGCIHCGGCMVGCRHNAKNTLDRNYLYLAEQGGATIQAETEVVNIQPLRGDQQDDARYTVIAQSSTAFIKQKRRIRARHVVVAAGTLGTLRLLLRCRDETRTLPRLSDRLGDRVRTNSEALVGSTSRDDRHNYSEGIAITSVIRTDDVTHVEPVRYPEGSSFIRLLATPLIDRPGGFLNRLAQTVRSGFQSPWDFLKIKLFTPWARRSTILLVMQTVDNMVRIRWGRNKYTLWRKGLVSRRAEGQLIAPDLAFSADLTRRFARKTNGVPQASFAETLLGIATTAHILGGVPMGRAEESGVVDVNCEVFNYPGLYVIDGSIVPANPGINPSLTITALAEYANSRIPAKDTAAD